MGLLTPVRAETSSRDIVRVLRRLFSFSPIFKFIDSIAITALYVFASLKLVIAYTSCCVTAPIGSAPYFRPQKCGTYMPKSGARNDIIYPTPKSRLGALAPQWVRTQKANRCTPDFKRSTQSPRPCPIMGKGAALKDIPYFGTTCLRRINFKAKEKCRTQPQGLSPTLFLTVPV